MSVPRKLKKKMCPNCRTWILSGKLPYHSLSFATNALFNLKYPFEIFIAQHLCRAISFLKWPSFFSKIKILVMGEQNEKINYSEPFPIFKLFELLQMVKTSPQFRSLSLILSSQYAHSYIQLNLKEIYLGIPLIRKSYRGCERWMRDGGKIKYEFCALRE